MWIMLVQRSEADRRVWAGRRWCAALDAILWPAVAVALLAHVPAPVGLVGPVAVAIGFALALVRLRRAIWLNHRYRFTSERWGRVLAFLLVVAVILKVVLPA